METYVYVLKSIGFNKTYTGITPDIQKRLSEHNSGSNAYTKKFKPWKLIYYEKYQNLHETKLREKYLKSHAGRNFIKKKLFDKQ